jgi:hypothetical protein
MSDISAGTEAHQPARGTTRRRLLQGTAALAGWGTTLAPMKHLSGLKLDCFYEYMNWYTSGFQGAFIARQGYYSGVPENAKSSSPKRSGITGTAASRQLPTSPIPTAN